MYVECCGEYVTVFILELEFGTKVCQEDCFGNN